MVPNSAPELSGSLIAPIERLSALHSRNIGAYFNVHSSVCCRFDRSGKSKMALTQDWAGLASQLMSNVGTDVPPIAITFADAVPEGIPVFDDPMPPPKADGRTGRVSAGCVFWMKSTDRTFATVAEDHENCSVGSLTHGLKTLDEVASNEDVAAILECNWVTMEVVPEIPVVTEKPGSIVYGPLAETSIDPDVVLMRVTARQLMVLSDALPDLALEGKPQCHIVAMAKEHGVAAASVG